MSNSDGDLEGLDFSEALTHALEARPRPALARVVMPRPNGAADGLACGRASGRDLERREFGVLVSRAVNGRGMALSTIVKVSDITGLG